MRIVEYQRLMQDTPLLLLMVQNTLPSTSDISIISSSYTSSINFILSSNLFYSVLSRDVGSVSYEAEIDDVLADLLIF